MRSGADADVVEIKRKVEIPVSIESTTVYGEATDDAAIALGDLTQMRKDFGGLDVRVSSSALAGLGLVVDPGCRRHGVGRELTKARLGWLGERTDRAWYFVSSANRASIDLHTGFGFRLVASDVDVPGVAFTASGQLFCADLPALAADRWPQAT